MNDQLKQQLGSHIAKFDHLAITLMPQDVQLSIYVLCSFFAELDVIPATVSEPMLGEIRYQWWRDVINEKNAQSPLAEKLLEAMQTHNWAEKPLLDMIDAKIFDLYANPMETKTQFEAYAGHTYSTLLQLTANSIAPATAKLFSDVSGHLGVAFCVAKYLTYLKVHQSRGQVFIPQDILSQHALSTDDFIAAQNLASINACLQAFAAYGQDHYQQAKSHLNKLDSKAKSALFPTLLPSIRSKLILSNAKKHENALFQKLETISPSQLSFQWQLVKANLFKKI